jgi:hypothetical protein
MEVLEDKDNVAWDEVMGWKSLMAIYRRYGEAVELVDEAVVPGSYGLKCEDM